MSNLWRFIAPAGAAWCLAAWIAIPAALGAGAEAIELGSRLELFVDDYLVEEMDGVTRRLHHPVPREVAITFDAPHEGNTSAYVRVFRDGDRFRMYYRGSDFDWTTHKETHPQLTCYAESSDGIHWEKPELGLFEFGGSKKNNIVWMGRGTHNFAPFKDTNPNARPDERYKAVAGDYEAGLWAYASPDGIRWREMRSEAIITEGAFDSQNLAFYDNVRGRYVDFHRHSRDGKRDIMTATSSDFLTWTAPKFFDYGDAAHEHLYTNATVAYDRAPHIFLAFPKRFVPERAAAVQPIPEHDAKGVSDGVLMASRDGEHWRKYDEAFLRPGLNRHRWWQRNNMIAWGILSLPSDLPGHAEELSLYSTENYYVGPCKLRRYTLRTDGFVSINAPHKGGTLVTKPLTFSGKKLAINYATSAAGSIRCEILGADGKPLSGYSLADCPEIYGDQLEQLVAWNRGAELGDLAGQPIRLRFEMRDADLYSIRFQE